MNSIHTKVRVSLHRAGVLFGLCVCARAHATGSEENNNKKKEEDWVKKKDDDVAIQKRKDNDNDNTKSQSPFELVRTTLASFVASTSRTSIQRQEN